MHIHTVSLEVRIAEARTEAELTCADCTTTICYHNAFVCTQHAHLAYAYVNSAQTFLGVWLRNASPRPRHTRGPCCGDSEVAASFVFTSDGFHRSGSASLICGSCEAQLCASALRCQRHVATLLRLADKDWRLGPVLQAADAAALLPRRAMTG